MVFWFVWFIWFISFVWCIRFVRLGVERMFPVIIFLPKKLEKPNKPKNPFS
jgi:hypothetical protein